MNILRFETKLLMIINATPEQRQILLRLAMLRPDYAELHSLIEQVGRQEPMTYTEVDALNELARTGDDAEARQVERELLQILNAFSAEYRRRYTSPQAAPITVAPAVSAVRFSA